MQKNNKFIKDFLAKQTSLSILTSHNRRWLTLAGSPSFRIMSYNMLADSNIEPYLFKGRDLSQIKMVRRFAFIEKEIREVRPDILCCQEVDSGEIEELRNMLNYTSEEVF